MLNVCINYVLWNAFISGPYWKLIVVLLNMPSTINKDVIIIIIIIIIIINTIAPLSCQLSSILSQ